MPIPIPDLSDGLTPSARRLLVAIDAMVCEKERLHPEEYSSVKTWGPVQAVHLEDPSTPVMDLFAMALRLARDWVCRYPLIDTQGNFGTIDGDLPAGMRYTEVSLTEIGTSFLPGGPSLSFPNLLCNGAWAHSGSYLPDDGEQAFQGELPAHLCDCVPHEPIAGGERLSFLPPHNLAEIGRALLLLLDRPGASLSEVMERMPGPDFPTGGLIANPESLSSLYETGEGLLRVRARIDIERRENGKSSIVIREIPYGLTKTMIIEQIAEMVQKGALPGVFDVLELSSHARIRMQVEVRAGTDPLKIRDQLLRESPLQHAIPVRMKVRVSGESRTVGLLELLKAWIQHEREALRLRSGSHSDEVLRKQLQAWIDTSDPRRTTIGV